MKRRLRRLIVFAGVLGLVMALNVGVAFADHTGGTEWTCDTGTTSDGELCEGGDRETIGPAAEQIGPVGRHIMPEDAPGHPGAVNGFGNPSSNAVNAINNNPLCPFHGVTGTFD